MGLFVKKHDTGTHLPLYTSGVEKTILIVGLGNVGKKYEKTRHNIGFLVIDEFSSKNGFPKWSEKKSLNCYISIKVLHGVRVILIKPTTLMNNSGEAVQAVMHFYKIQASQLFVTYDELDLHFGTIRTQVGGSSAGHNGIKSIIEHTGSEFGRIRIGIGPKLPAQIEGADFVLAPFSPKQLKNLPIVIKEANVILLEMVATQALMADTRTVI